VQSNDVVNTGFIESDTARVEVQVVYDELAALDDDSLEITRLTREVNPKDPLALNLMRITVDGKPIDDPGKSISDIERCTDVALDRANIQFQFDNLELKPRLSVTAWPVVIQYRDDPETEYLENLMRFRTYTNYPAFIGRAEIRIFESAQSERDAPLAVIDVNKDGYAEWQPSFDNYEAPGRELKYVLRVYDKDGHFDETKTQPIRVVDAVQTDLQDHDAQKELLVGYGETRIATENIKKKGGIIRVHGSGIPSEHSVWVAGRAVPVGKEGKFVTEAILPPGMHTVEVAVLDRAGNGRLFLRDLELKTRPTTRITTMTPTWMGDSPSTPRASLAMVGSLPPALIRWRDLSRTRSITSWISPPARSSDASTPTISIRHTATTAPSSRTRRRLASSTQS
jgi:hypothetical protein